MAVEIQRGSVAGVSHPLFKLREGGFFEVAPDGKRFIVEILPASATHMIGVENWFDELNRLAPVKR